MCPDRPPSLGWGMTNLQRPSRRRVLAAFAATATAAALPVAAAGPAALPAAAADVRAADTAALASAESGLRLQLPAPSGRHAIGATELHLVDSSRNDPWVSGRKRELMTTVWYPALRSAPGPRTPYMPAEVAPLLAAQLTSSLNLRPEQLDYAGTPTHARTGVPAFGRHPVVLYSPGFWHLPPRRHEPRRGAGEPRIRRGDDRPHR